jgi:HAD superfamily phosphoserine phosphatase-like hydrolase
MSAFLEDSGSGPSDFLEAVLSLRPTIAAFDCDGTLWACDSGMGFFDWAARRVLSDEASERARRLTAEYERGQIGEEQMCGQVAAIHDGALEAEIERAAAQYFAEEVEAHIYPEMRELTRRLSAAGCELWAVSATNVWLVREGAARFGIPASRVLATTVEVRDGRATSRPTQVPTGEGKVAALRRSLSAAIDVAFGNSIHDAPMLGAARRAFAINPDPDLSRAARDRGFRVYRTAR